MEELKRIIKTFKKAKITCRKKKNEDKYICKYKGVQEVTAIVELSPMGEPQIVVELPAEDIDGFYIDDGQLNVILSALNANDDATIDYKLIGGFTVKPKIILQDPEKAIKLMKVFGDHNLYIDVGEKRGRFIVKLAKDPSFLSHETLWDDELRKLFE